MFYYNQEFSKGTSFFEHKLRNCIVNIFLPEIILRSKGKHCYKMLFYISILFSILGFTRSASVEVITLALTRYVIQPFQVNLVNCVLINFSNSDNVLTLFGIELIILLSANMGLLSKFALIIYPGADFAGLFFHCSLWSSAQGPLPYHQPITTIYLFIFRKSHNDYRLFIYTYI